jgi:phospholipase C
MARRYLMTRGTGIKAMPNLTEVSIEFDTLDDDKDFNTVVHVFVKNRLDTTSGSEGNPDFITNFLASQRYLAGGDLADHASSPYLAYGIGLASTFGFDNGSHKKFALTLMPQPVTLADIVLPAVDIHILTHGNDTWRFDYKVTFSFDDDGVSDFSYSSRDDGGLPGISLDQDNRNYSGICAENPLVPVPAPSKPLTKSAMKSVTMDFFTHDDNKDGDTRLDVEIVNRLNAASSTVIASGANLLPGVEFVDKGPVHTIRWPSADGKLTLSESLLADMVLPEIIITIHPNGDDAWIFDYRVTFEFSDPNDFAQKSVFYATTTSGVLLDQDHTRHVGVYQGPSFPAVAARPAAPLTLNPDPAVRTTRIPMALVRRKLDEFINNRNGPDTNVAPPLPPLRKIRLHNAGVYNDEAFPESYADVRSITAVHNGITYVSSPVSLGQENLKGITNTVYLNDVNSDNLSMSVDSVEPPIFSLVVHFETLGPEEAQGLVDLDFSEFSITLKLSLGLLQTDGRTVIDALNWMTELANLDKTAKAVGIDAGGNTLFHYTGTLLGQPVDVTSTQSAHDIFIDELIHVHLVTSEITDPGKFLREGLRDAIFDTLNKPVDHYGTRTARDGINSTVTSWLVGGISDDDVDIDDGHNIEIFDLHGEGETDQIVITHSAPENIFVPPTPADWPTKTNPNPAWNFAPGTLSHIDHIVVLTMENRSFDHMLGYLSLPVAQGGLGRTDVDGLKGNESNAFRGKPFPTVAVTDTFFSPDPPHGFEPVHRAINGGLMDGFVAEYAAENGAAIAGQIMGHQTATTVPTYDALARDFTIGHRWFAGHPGPTFCNRFTELTGHLNLDPRGFWEFDNSSPLRPVFTKTIFDYLSDPAFSDTGQPVSWNYFEQGYCFLRFFAKYTFDDEHIVDLNDPDRGFFALAKAGTLPSVSFIDPHYIELPPGANADGAPADVKDGQAFVRQVVEAVVASPAWGSTLLVIVYDEHGGFYDHVPPSAAAKVSPELPIDTHGVRVPSFLISPWVGAGAVFGSDAAPVPAHPKQRADLHFDHTSLLRTIARRFMSANPPYLGARYAAANDLSSVVGNTKRQTQFLPFLRHNFQFSASQQMLGVKDASPAPGAPLWQLPADGTAAQEFSFEDAGNGLWYIRSNVSNLYLTVQAPTTAQVAAEPAAQAGAVGPVPVPQPIPPSVIQDVKVVPGVTSAQTAEVTTDLPAVARQKWILRPVSSALGPDLFLIGSEAAPGLVLMPADSTQSGPVVLHAVPLGAPPGTGAWKVTSPALSH